MNKRLVSHLQPPYSSYGGEVAATLALARYPITDTPLLTQPGPVSDRIHIRQGTMQRVRHEINGRIITGWLSGFKSADSVLSEILMPWQNQNWAI